MSKFAPISKARVVVRRRSRKADPRFGLWLNAVPVAWAKVARELGIDARQLRRVRQREVEPTASRTWAIGEAVHACGVAWCSGPVALFESNHLPEFVDFIAALAAGHPRQAAELVAALALLSGEPLTPLPPIVQSAVTALQARKKPAAVVDAREQLKACYSEAYGPAWARAIGKNTASKNQRDAPVDLKVARILAAAGQDRERVILALVEWVGYSQPALVDDTLYARLAAARAGAEVAWAGPRLAKYFEDILRTKAESIEKQMIGVGRGKNEP
jgi:hypothetical protein